MKTQRFGLLAASGSLLSASSLLAATPALAQGPWALDANIGAVSNYIWRGVSQSGDSAAVQGGLDASHESGFYAGTWASNVDFGPGGANYELDLYLGYDFTLPDENASLGLNTIYYAYPDDGGNIDFWEIGISGGYGVFSAGIQYTVWGDKDNEDTLFDQGDLYYGAALDFPLPQDFGFGIFGGYYDFNHDDVVVGVIEQSDGSVLERTKSADYWHWGATVSKDAGQFGTFNFTYEQNGGRGEIYDDDPKFWVGWLKEF